MTSQTSSVLLRLPSSVHRRLKREAAQSDMSLNKFCYARLTGATTHAGSSIARQEQSLGYPSVRIAGGELKEIAEDVVELYQGELEGLVLFGSWVRGEASAASDIDLLLIMENHAVIDRDRYSHWLPRRVLEHEVSPLFVHLPADVGSITGLWLEAAIDGIVLFDKTMAVSRFLAAARRMIAQGHVRRMMTHGHPYWVHNVKREDR